MIAHASTVRLSLRKGKAEQRVMKVRRAIHCMHKEPIHKFALIYVIFECYTVFELAT